MRVNMDRAWTRSYRRWLCAACVGIGAPFAALAQTSPVDLPDLSLSDLLKVRIADAGDAPGKGMAAVSRLQLQYDYIRNQFEGYRSSTHGVALSSLLATGAPPGPGRFPVLPTRIVQQAHTFTLSYEVLDDTVLSLVVPTIKQHTDHISIVPGFAAFRIASDGLGDVAASASRRFWQSPAGQFHATAGISAPTGSIDEKGDTPRSPPGGRDQLPYTMQLGSGTWDVLLDVGYRGRVGDGRQHLSWLGTVDWGIYMNGKLRTGRNDRDYRLGHVFNASVWVLSEPLNWLRSKLELQATVWGRIRGEDKELKVGSGAAAFFPAPVTNPDLFGGERLNLVFGVEFGKHRAPATGFLDNLLHANTSLEFGFPVYQRLNGPQVEQEWHLSGKLSWRF